MGIIKFFKELSNFTKIVTDAAQAASEESAELPVLHANMDDDTLFETAVERIDILVELNEEDAENAPLTLPQRYCYALNLLELEVNNGGLCQFFVNSSRSLAPYVDECLQAIGAEKHRKLFAEFVTNNQINLNSLDSFRISSVEEYAAKTEHYDFDAFDNSYYELSPLQDFIVAYVKANISEF